MSGPGLGLGLPEAERSRWNGGRALVIVQVLEARVLAVETTVAAIRPSFGRTRRNCSSKPDQRRCSRGSWQRDAKTLLEQSRSRTRNLLSKRPGGEYAAFRIPRPDISCDLAGRYLATSVGGTRGALGYKRPFGTKLTFPLGRFEYRRLLLVPGIGWPESWGYGRVVV